ncbi:hypothetical protein P5673_009309 [Acropora cervicornis]|uniref:Uncharacterized protein n=1 Tax=Acropora cervicornis TaxID=6130 RepID=A0AAD9QSP7_ACRCE|nr:hypothetical protein P5673_009309 [Acropora cervicornis]
MAADIQIKNFIHDEERKPEQTTSFYLLTDSDTKPLDDLLEKIVDIIAKNDKCKGLDNELPPGCSITEDCFRLTCAKRVDNKDISLTMKFNRCDKPVTVTIDVKVEKENWERSYVFSSGEEMALGDSAMYVRVIELKDEEGNLTLQRSHQVYVVIAIADEIL